MYEPTIVDQVPALRAQLADAERRRDAARAGVGALIAQAQSRGQESVPQAEVEQLRSQREQARAEIDRLQQLLAIAGEEAAYRAASADVRPSGFPAGGPGPAGQVLSLGAGTGPAEPAGAERVWRYADTGRPAAVGRGERLADHHAAREHAARWAERDRQITSTHGGIAQYVRALTTSGASAVVPTDWAFPIIDKARNTAVCMQAGCTLVPMPAKIIQIGRLTTDPTAAFKTEGNAITASDPAFDYVQLTATSLTALTVASLEFLQDAPNADQIVTDAISQAMALELDKAILFGQLGATGTNDEGAAFGLASPYPKGILKNLLDNAAGQVLGFATNGTAQTAATPWNEILAAFYQVKRANEVPGAFVSSDRLPQQYDSMYDTTYQPLRKPASIANVPWLTTNVIPSFTRGTMSSRATDLFIGDWSQVLVGERMSLDISVLTERYAELGQVGIRAYWRGDVQVARPAAMVCYRALQGAT